MGNVQSKVTYSSMIVHVDSKKLEYNIIGNSISIRDLLNLINEFREDKITTLYKKKSTQYSNGTKLQKIELKDDDIVNKTDQLYTS
jgi:hypothetical protein